MVIASGVVGYNLLLIPIHEQYVNRKVVTENSTCSLTNTQDMEKLTFADGKA